MGSWKIMAISRPRTSLISSKVKSKRLTSIPSALRQKILPVECAPSGCKRKGESAVNVLPEPDSPTKPRISPSRMVRLTLSTARIKPSGVSSSIVIFFISSRIISFPAAFSSLCASHHPPDSPTRRTQIPEYLAALWPMVPDKLSPARLLSSRPIRMLAPEHLSLKSPKLRYPE